MMAVADSLLPKACGNLLAVSLLGNIACGLILFPCMDAGDIGKCDLC